MGEPLKVLVTGAAGQIAYSLVIGVAKGDVFGPDRQIILVLLDIPPMAEVLEGVVLELKDCALPLLKEVIATTDVSVAFNNIDAAMLVGAMPRRDGMERKDLLAANVKIFKEQGSALDKHAKKTVKVVVVGNPANTNALICSHYAPSIPKSNFSCLTRLDQNRAQSLVAGKLNIAVNKVKNITIWGNHSSTQFPDVRHAVVDIGGKSLPAGEAIGDDNYCQNEFIKTVQQRGGAIIKLRKLSSAMSAAKATCDHMKDWFFGTSADSWVSMGVISDGNTYGIPEGLMYSFPVRVKDGRWEVVKGLEISNFAREKMDATATELVEEKKVALAACEA